MIVFLLVVIVFILLFGAPAILEFLAWGIKWAVIAAVSISAFVFIIYIATSL